MKYTAVMSDGTEGPLICDADDDLWIAVAEQYPQDDPTVFVEYVEDEAGEVVDY